MINILSFIQSINNFIWGLPMLILLMGTHVFFSFRLGFIQKKTLLGIKLSITADSSGEGDISGFATLATTLAATIGTGNIVGISTAVAFGGPGAILWCWLTGILGMATTYAECYLSFLFRKKTRDGTYLGGPMYILEQGLHSKFLGFIFAFFTLVASYGVGCSTQANSITAATTSLWGLSPVIVGFIVALLIGLVIVGGVKKIGQVCVKLVPAMGAFYMIGCIILLFLNYQYLIDSILLIIKAAFTPVAVAGGLIGSSMKSAARYGISRGLFTNEAGLGSAGIIAASAKTLDPARQALISMTATFWDTVVMCAITGLVIVSNLLKFPNSIIGYTYGELTTAAFNQIPYVGETVLGIALIAFATATLLGWSFFGERACEYLFGKRSINLYRIGYIVMIFIGAIMSLDLVWELSDLVNAFMAIPNLIGILCLNRYIKRP